METMWWPSVSALKDLTISENEEGLLFDAPDGTECGDWLAYFNETIERQAVFAENILSALREYKTFRKKQKLFKCTETGFVSTASGLTRYQKNRSIKTTNRIPVESNG